MEPEPVAQDRPLGLGRGLARGLLAGGLAPVEDQGFGELQVQAGPRRREDGDELRRRDLAEVAGQGRLQEGGHPRRGQHPRVGRRLAVGRRAGAADQAGLGVDGGDQPGDLDQGAGGLPVDVGRRQDHAVPVEREVPASLEHGHGLAVDQADRDPVRVLQRHPLDLPHPPVVRELPRQMAEVQVEHRQRLGHRRGGPHPVEEPPRAPPIRRGGGRIERDVAEIELVRRLPVQPGDHRPEGVRADRDDQRQRDRPAQRGDPQPGQRRPSGGRGRDEPREPSARGPSASAIRGGSRCSITRTPAPAET